MGLSLSIGGNEAFKKLYDSLSQKSLPLYLCFVLHETHNQYDDPTDLLNKITTVLHLIEAKYLTKKNKYALVKSQIGTNLVDFCDADQFLAQINPIIYSNDDINVRQNPIHPQDVYEQAYLNLSWTNAIKILLDINNTITSKSSPASPYRLRLIYNYGIDVFDMESIGYLDILASRLRQMSAKKVIEKYVPLYKFTKPYSQKQTRFYANAARITFKQAVLRKEYIVREFDERELAENVDFSSDVVNVRIEDVPFAQGNEVYCFMGEVYEERNGQHITLQRRVFKLAKFKEINLTENFLAQTFAAFLAKEFSKN